MEEQRMFERQLMKVPRVYILLALLCFSFFTSVQAAELKRLSLDDTASLGTRLTADPVVKLEGSGSVRISTLWPTTICLGELSGLDVDHTKLVYQAKVKCEKLEGTAFLEMWCHVDGGQYFSRGLNSTVTGTMNWKTLQTPFLLQAGQTANKVTLNVVINGRGTVWIDDAHLLKEPLD
jgi:hypothetical protein